MDAVRIDANATMPERFNLRGAFCELVRGKVCGTHDVSSNTKRVLAVGICAGGIGVVRLATESAGHGKRTANKIAEFL
jgi:hypothetical protein